MRLVKTDSVSWSNKTGQKTLYNGEYEKIRRRVQERDNQEVYGRVARNTKASKMIAAMIISIPILCWFYAVGLIIQKSTPREHTWILFTTAIICGDNLRIQILTIEDLLGERSTGNRLAGSQRRKKPCFLKLKSLVSLYAILPTYRQLFYRYGWGWETFSTRITFLGFDTTFRRLIFIKKLFEKHNATILFSRPIGNVPIVSV